MNHFMVNQLQIKAFFLNNSQFFLKNLSHFSYFKYVLIRAPPFSPIIQHIPG